MNQKTKTLVIMGILTALSAVGAFIKIPSPTGTVAFDSAPGYIAALILGPLNGGIVAALGHLISSATVGFPLTLPIHLIIGIEMAVFAIVFSLANKYINLWSAVIIATILNGILASASFIPLFGKGFFVSMAIPLVVASFANIIISAVVYRIVRANIKYDKTV